MELNLIDKIKSPAMNKKTLIPVFLLLAIVAIAYAIYKGLAVTMTTIEAGRTIVYGQPQHGLTLGLCLFAGACIIGATLLALDDRYRASQTDGQTDVTTTSTSSKKIATNYPR